MRVLVAYASNAGSTADVAKAIGEEIERNGATVEVRPVAGIEATGLSNYDAYVIGAPMILGWHRDGAHFLKTNRGILAQKPTAVFVTALSLTKTDLPATAFPVYVDPKLAKAPLNAKRLKLKERYARLSNYLGPIVKSAPGVKFVSVGFFGGKLDFGRLKLPQMLFTMLLIGAQPGDYRNWEAIRGWAREVAEKLR